MKPLAILTAAVLIALTFCSTRAQAHRPMTKSVCNDVQGFIAIEDLELMAAKAAAQRGTTSDTEIRVHNLEADKIAAIRKTVGIPSLKAAIEDYVITAREYLESIAPRSDEIRLTYQARVDALQARMDRADERANTELQLACPNLGAER